MTASSQRPGPRPLLGGGSLAILIGGACLLLWVLMPLARERLHKAQSAAPSSLSLNYMELSLRSRPEDVELRRALVKKQIESGQLVRARQTLLPLMAASLSAGVQREVRWTLLELDRALWAAVDVTDSAARAAALEQVVQDARALAALSLPPEQQSQLADLYLELDQPRMAAELLDGLARAGLPDAERYIDAADAAWLGAGAGRQAAELQAFAAARRGARGIEHARLAIARAQASGDSAATGAMTDRMRGLFPDDLGLLELATELAESYAVSRAYELAGELSRRAPAEPKYHRLVARLAEATGRQLRALDEYVWLVRHGGDARDRERAIALAKANWDLRLLRELLGTKREPAAATRGAKPHSAAPRRRSGLRRCQAAGRRRPASAPEAPLAPRSRRLREALALDEALGDHVAVLQKLSRALEGELATLPELWRRKLDLEHALGDVPAALRTAQAMLARFGGGKPAVLQVASLQLELGDTRAALQTLLAAQLQPSEQDAAWWMKVAGLAFEAGDIAAERAAYRKLIRLPGAAHWQYQRLWELAPDRAAALRIAREDFERFDSASMFFAALAIYREDGDEAGQVAWLERAEQSERMRSSADYWQARIDLHQQRCARATQAGEHALAKRELTQAGRLIDRAQRFASLPAVQQERLLRTQGAQTLSLGLASDDRALIATGYAARRARLSARERVYILQQLGRNEEALLLARQTLSRGGLNETDRGVLELDARALSAGRQQFLRLTGDALQMDGLAMWGSLATLQYAGRAAGLRAEVSLTQLQARASQTPVLQNDVRELSAALHGRIARVGLELGVRARDESNLRPFGSLALRLAGDLDDGTYLRLHVNTNATDTARQRAWGARDAIELQTALPLGAGFYVSARGIAEAYYTRLEREYVGAGLSLDAGVGVNVELPRKLGAAGFRVTGRLAPRFEKDKPPTSGVVASSLSGPWLPQSSEWAGVGASLGRGKLDAPPLIGRAFCYVLDGAAGWLWPQQGIGYSARAGLGVSLFGADLLTLAARGGNVVGSTVWSANLGYGVSLDR